MADIDVERKGPSIWPWIIGLIVLAVLIWALMEMFGGDEEDVVVPEPVATEPVRDPAARPPTATAAGPIIADVLADPERYFGQSFTTDTVTVAEVVSDRGFWVQSATGQRLFVVKNESPEEGVADVQGQRDVRPARDVAAGDRLRIEGTLEDAANVDVLAPPLDDATRQALRGQRIFLLANVENIEHME